ncbi:arginine/ornithine antiporter [Weissella oryzae SG25]|uniref:Arginine/ornithine antiporter n=1 Tax=Weissella oryzae (strain DSM 25784 / JCM 18191 / LMG 30913 / SG25) TaxID=1329250 RepID=A0A069CZG5_WEIOS|nr:YfcC family protein [Weissella oryzae]GAK30481.1 arginine/ornithine antiporter [Weissella oryzae SG25]
MDQQKKKMQMPSAYTILFIITAVIAVLTWLIPAGKYKTSSAGQIIPGTYTTVASHAQGLWDVLMAPINGMLGNASTDGAIMISLFILIIGGFLGVVNATDSLNAGIASLLKRYAGKEKLLIPLLMVLFGLGGSSYGMSEEIIPLFALIIPVMMAVGYDAIVGISIALVGSQVGCLASTVNPFATGVASQTVGISVGDGMGLRLIMLVVLIAISIWFTMSYANKIKQDPTKSLLYSQRKADEAHFDTSALENFKGITKTQKSVNVLFFTSFIIMIVSLIPWDQLNTHWTLFDNLTKWLVGIPFLGKFLGTDMIPLGQWYFAEISMWFMLMAIIVAIFAKMSENKFINAFMNGAAEMMGVALVVAVARGVQVIMNDGMITGTVLHFGEQSLHGLPAGIFIVLTYIFYIPMSFLIPSTSGLAAATMGIMGPLGTFAHVDKSLVITAYQSASGIVNLISPTSAVVMGALTIGRTNIVVWFKYVWKLLLILFIATCVLLIIGTML